ncbi:TetR/AcrR family transcriptional regulator [Streptomyces sp. NPDC003077]|uniref:TetR/AcrR family transcriptional regulator n=1 Tax=Streptomyces sp. NPDC003077 TaxID=3154443 RepID=UPI0033BC6B26
MDQDEARSRLLDAAEELFSARGVHAVGMDDIRAASGVSLKRLYQCFPSKHDLVEGWLRRRDTRWRAALATHVLRDAGAPRDRVLAVFDWLHAWCAGPGFRGCAFVNTFGELGAVAPGVARAARDHKQAVREYLTTLAQDAGAADPAALGEQLTLLVDGAITTAAIGGDPAAVGHARAAAQTLTRAATAGRRNGDVDKG